MNPTARRNSRYYALQAVYQWEISKNDMYEIEKDFIKNQLKRKTDVEYFKEIIHYVPNNIPLLNDTITPFLNRSLKEIDPIELSILRIATYEFKERLDVPYKVVLNEALELTKQFGSIEGFKFVNGVLHQVAKVLRVAETTPRDTQ